MGEPTIVTVDDTNVDRYGFFCYKSKPKTAGYRQKRDWLAGRFAEGLRIKLIYEGGKPAGFVEYTPGEAAWRAVHAPNYLVIHCLWVVGRGKGKGYGSRLVGACLDEARAMGKAGVAMVTSRRNWLAGSKLLVKNGFEVVDHSSWWFARPATRPLPPFPRTGSGGSTGMGRG
jgi:ribosomal protein S18 acetylase RimI-like enzyme